MAVEGASVVGRAPPGSAYFSQTKAASLGDQNIAKVEVPGAAAFRRHAAPGHDFRSNLITVPANPHTTVDCNIAFRSP